MGLVATLAEDTDRGRATLEGQPLAFPVALQVVDRSTDMVIAGNAQSLLSVTAAASSVVDL